VELVKLVDGEEKSQVKSKNEVKSNITDNEQEKIDVR